MRWGFFEGVVVGAILAVATTYASAWWHGR